MFISKERKVVIPQSEHQRLAGILAMHWGNHEFTLPTINRNSFNLGVATHDRAFGCLDTAALGQISEEDRVVQVDQWLDTSYSDVAAELVILLHVRRLMNTPELQTLYQKLDARIQEIISTSDLDLTVYEQADTVTDFCDLIAFDFSFESDASRTVTVYQNQSTTTDITYKLSDGKITVDNWPFNVPKIEGYILGYQQAGYPENLQPIILSFEIVPK